MPPLPPATGANVAAGGGNTYLDPGPSHSSRSLYSSCQFRFPFVSFPQLSLCLDRQLKAVKVKFYLSRAQEQRTKPACYPTWCSSPAPRDLNLDQYPVIPSPLENLTLQEPSQSWFHTPPEHPIARKLGVGHGRVLQPIGQGAEPLLWVIVTRRNSISCCCCPCCFLASRLGLVLAVAELDGALSILRHVVPGCLVKVLALRLVLVGDAGF